VAVALMADGQADAAVAMLEAKPFSQTRRFAALAQAYAMAGRFDNAADTILLSGRGNVIEEAARLIRGAPAKVSDPSALPALYQWFDFVYAHIGAPERLLDYPERAVQADELFKIYVLFLAEYASVRKTERFKTLARNMGLVDYWKARGWPDLCHPIGANDFACD
jgi:hypothetical protein